MKVFLILLLLAPLGASSQMTKDDSLRFWCADVARFCIVESNLKTYDSDKLKDGWIVYADSAVGKIYSNTTPIATVTIKEKTIRFMFMAPIADNIINMLDEMFNMLRYKNGFAIIYNSKTAKIQMLDVPLKRY